VGGRRRGVALDRHVHASAVENDQIKKGMEQLEGDKKLVTKNKDAYKVEQKKVEDKIKSLQKIGAGVQERMNWQLLHQYINMSTPQPNGDHMVDSADSLEPVRKKYWTEAAKKAYKDLEESRFSTKTLDPAVQKKREVEIKKNLIQVNIAGINALYTDDLYAFFNKIKNDRPALPGMHPNDVATLNAFLNEKDAKKREKYSDQKDGPRVSVKDVPKEAWIVEVRGYTYQKDNEKFIEETIIENLRNPENVKDHTGKNIALSPDLIEQIRKNRISFLILYQNKMVENPVPGQFELIGKSYLKVLQRGIPAAAAAAEGGKGPGAPMPANLPGAGGAGGAAEVKATRESWRPIGDVASDLFSDNPAAAGAGPAAKDAAVAVQPIPRTEFVVVFVWAEPIAGTQPINLTGNPTDKK